MSSASPPHRLGLPDDALGKTIVDAHLEQEGADRHEVYVLEFEDGSTLRVASSEWIASVIAT